MAALRLVELDKRTLRRGGATWGSFLRAEVVTRGGIEGGESVASLHQNRGEKGVRRGAGLAWPCHAEKKRREGGVRCAWCLSGGGGYVGR
jgi:hypothetical protein